MAQANILTAKAAIEIAAPIEKVFDAWLDPKFAARFLMAGKSTAADAKIDARVGGVFELVMRGPDGDYHHQGRYVAIERPARLVFTWISPGTSMRLSLVTVSFRQIPGGVRVELLHEGLPDEARAEGHNAGWAKILDRLKEVTARRDPA